MNRGTRSDLFGACSVFISYSREDRVFVEREILPVMEAAGIECSYDQSETRTAENWRIMTRQALEESDWFLVIVSPRSVASRWVRGEVEWAMNQRRDKMVVVLMEPCAVEALHRFLPQIRPVDFASNAALARRQLSEMANQRMAGTDPGTGVGMPVTAEREPAGDSPSLFSQSPAFPSPEAVQSVFDEDVQFTVYRPQTVAPLEWQTWLTFAHRGAAGPEEPDYAAEVEEQARAILGAKFDDYAQGRQESSIALPRETTITIVPTVDGMDFSPAQRSFTWQEPVHREEFRARARASAGGILRGKITFFLGAIIIAEINVKVTVTTSPAATAAPAPMGRDQARVYRKIFASYSRRDSPIVDHFESIVAVFGDRYLRDVRTLRAGEEWSPGLERMIREADVFQLFWSTNSMHSRFVRQEYDFALGLRRTNFIRPTFWENPFPQDERADLPPQALSKLHFERLPFFVAESPKAFPPPRDPGPMPCAPPPSSGPSPRRGHRNLTALATVAGLFLACGILGVRSFWNSPNPRSVVIDSGGDDGPRPAPPPTYPTWHPPGEDDERQIEIRKRDIRQELEAVIVRQQERAAALPAREAEKARSLARRPPESFVEFFQTYWVRNWENAPERWADLFAPEPVLDAAPGSDLRTQRFGERQALAARHPKRIYEIERFESLETVSDTSVRVDFSYRYWFLENGTEEGIAHTRMTVQYASDHWQITSFAEAPKN